MRKYGQSHQWIKFSANLAQSPPQLWMKLGEAASKCDHIAGIPLQPYVAEQLHQIYLAKGVVATTAIEGNTLSEKDVLEHLEGKLELPKSKDYLRQEVDNIINACNQIGSELLQGNLPSLSGKRIKDFNGLVLHGLKLEDDVITGEFRTHSVVVGNIYKAPPAEDCDYLIDRMCNWLTGEDFQSPDEETKIVYALLRAIIAHLYIAWIHPFGDGNGRTARLIEFQMLLEAGVPFPAAHLLSNHYNQTRQEYYRQLNLTSKSGGDIIPFVKYAVDGFVDGLKEQLRLIRFQQWNVAWRNYVHESFQDKNSVAEVRQRRLALDLAQQQEHVPISKIAELTPRLAKAYANKSPKTISRDVNELVKIKLVEKTSKGIRARKEIILAFLPSRASD
ncbi:MAG: Fic family protein [Verrucomicrobiota bacterium]